MEQGPHINHTGWLPPVKERGGFEHMLTTQTYAAGNWKSAVAQLEREPLTAPTPVYSPTPLLPISSSSLSISTVLSNRPTPILPPHTPPHQHPLLPAGKPTSNACMQAIEMGHFLIKYNINYCEHHYRYVRFD